MYVKLEIQVVGKFYSLTSLSGHGVVYFFGFVLNLISKINKSFSTFISQLFKIQLSTDVCVNGSGLNEKAWAVVKIGRFWSKTFCDIRAVTRLGTACLKPLTVLQI